MRLTIWILIAIAVLSAAISFVAFRSRSETLTSRAIAHEDLESRVAARARADRLEAAWDPDHPVPSTEDVFSGVPDHLVRATPIDPAIPRRTQPRGNESTRIEIRWTSPRQVHALLERCTNLPRTDTAFAAATLADYELLAGGIPPMEAR